MKKILHDSSVACVLIVKKNILQIPVDKMEIGKGTGTLSRFFNGRRKRKSLIISDKDPSYKVRYLGNVQTAMMKGDGCVDKPVNILWNSYIRSPNPGLGMQLTISASGLKAYTKEQGLTEYHSHRISYCIAHPDYPKLFVWVYRHEGKKMKLELRCHAVLCKSEIKAKVITVQLHDRLSSALREFLREKMRNQKSRLNRERLNALNAFPNTGSIVPMRKQLLSTSQQYKPPVAQTNKAPKLVSISEGEEDDEEDDYDMPEEELTPNSSLEEEDSLSVTSSESSVDLVGGLVSKRALNSLNISTSDSLTDTDIELLSERLLDIHVQIGNNIDELKRDKRVQISLQRNSDSADSDDESSESGFHEHLDAKDSGIGTGEDSDRDISPYRELGVTYEHSDYLITGL